MDGSHFLGSVTLFLRDWRTKSFLSQCFTTRQIASFIESNKTPERKSTWHTKISWMRDIIRVFGEFICQRQNQPAPYEKWNSCAQGENGAGKSRANDMCLGLLEPTSGEINGVNGQDCQSRFTIKAANGNRNGSVLYVGRSLHGCTKHYFKW